MKVQIVKAHEPEQRAQAARHAQKVLGSGGLVFHPTETVYGIGGDGSTANNRLIARVKRRSTEQPLILLTPDLETLRAVVGPFDWTREVEALAERYWPGPLTLVLRCPEAPEGLAGPDSGVAVRITPEPTVMAILRSWQRPMTSTSANFSGARPARTLEQALQVLAGRSDLEAEEHEVLAIDAGETRGSLPSTIVSFVSWPPRLIREGLILRQEIERWLPALREPRKRHD